LTNFVAINEVCVQAEEGDAESRALLIQGLVGLTRLISKKGILLFSH